MCVASCYFHSFSSFDVFELDSFTIEVFELGLCITPYKEPKSRKTPYALLSLRMERFTRPSSKFLKSPAHPSGYRLSKLRASRVAEELRPDDEEKMGGNASSESDGEDDEPFMGEEEREEWRRKIREVVNKNQ
ncbi:hypothetical protein RHSIM_RhsimUnG0235500 [Rhododendron simsii]|uniref:Uncharacterized protein n=1 Tax=Rhododendron simsii TaxID=118357 RepID=A0A834FTD8_RHOSS|nr:hypothetical protein RHSIM_RhsimUnG0235500 [Rhododendron simsii]